MPQFLPKRPEERPSSLSQHRGSAEDRDGGEDGDGSVIGLLGGAPRARRVGCGAKVAPRTRRPHRNLSTQIQLGLKPADCALSHHARW